MIPGPPSLRSLAALPRRVVLLVSLVAAACLLLTAAPAAGHASLMGTDPPDGARLDAAPGTVTLTFDEPVEVPAAALRVFDADAHRVDVGPVDSGDPTVVAAALPDDLPDGGYVITYRIMSADDHPVGGVTTFTVGDAPAVDDTTVGELGAGTDAGLAQPVGIVLRGLSYLATLLAGGGGLYALAVARRSPDRRAARHVVVRAALVGAGASLLAVPVQAVAVAGGGIGAAVSSTAIGEVLGSSFGVGALVRAAALVWLVLAWRAKTPLALPAAVGLAAVASFALDGHQRSVEPTWLLIGGDVVHLTAAASWFAGIVLLAGALRRRSLEDDAVAAAGLVARFSTFALASFGLVAVAGVAMAIPLVGTPSALTSTTYGWLLVAKVAAVGVALVLAAYNRQRLVPAIAARRIPAGSSVDTAAVEAERRISRSHAAWGQLRRTVRIEAGVLAAVLAVTGVLVTVQPASEAAGLRGSYQTTVALGDELEVDVVVDPNQVGRNAIHLYVLDATGRPSTEIEDLHLELTYLPEDIGPIPIEPFFAGPGHWVANVDELTFAGDWEVGVVAGLDRFTELTTSVVVPVAP